jgi:hypothetical protein
MNVAELLESAGLAKATEFLESASLVRSTKLEEVARPMEDENLRSPYILPESCSICSKVTC